MFQIRNIFLINAVAILLLHSLTPHRHHEEMTYEEHKKAHQNANSIIDYLGIAFHQETNYNLENYFLEGTNYFKEVDSKGFNFPINATFPKVEILITKTISFYRSLPGKSLIKFIILANGLRAPPN
jgi:hypothetical protein